MHVGLHFIQPNLLAGYWTVSWLSTRTTPSTFSAICVASSLAVSLCTGPVSVTTPCSVSTEISRPLSVSSIRYFPLIDAVIEASSRAWPASSALRSSVSPMPLTAFRLSVAALSILSPGVGPSDVRAPPACLYRYRSRSLVGQAPIALRDRAREARRGRAVHRPCSRGLSGSG